MQEVVVTAEKKTERLLDTPVPVTALSADSLLTQNAVRLQDYYSEVPGLALDSEGNGQTNIIIRGISTSSKTGPTVGILIDDVPFGSTSVLGYGSLLAPDLDPAEISQLEVLRGPQGTLYGASSMGGLLKYVTTDPSTHAFSGRIEADVNGDIDGGVGFGVRGGLNIPLTDSLAVRVSGFDRRTPGYEDNIVDGARDVNALDVDGGRVSLLWKPTSSLNVKLGLLIQDTHNNGFDGENVTYGGSPLYGDLKQSEPPGSYRFHTLVQLYSGSLNYNLGFANLTSVTGYGLNQYYSTSNFPAYADLAEAAVGSDGAKLANIFQTRKFTQEVRLASLPGQRLEWLIGGFYDHESTPADQQLFGIDATTGVNAGELLNADFPTTYEEHAVFGDVTFHFTNQFDIQGGVRYSQNHQTYHERDDYAPALAAFGIPTPEFFSTKSSDDSTTFLVTPRYRFNSNLMVYARIASGYRPGGPNPSIPPGEGVPLTYTADTTVNYEVGLKGTSFERKVSYDVSLFDVEWKDIQVQLIDPLTQFTYFANEGTARSTGAEFAFKYVPFAGLRLSVNGSYDVAELTKDFPSSAGVGLAGNALPYTPRFQGSLSAEHDFPLPADWRGTAGATFSYVGRRYSVFAQDPTELRVILPSYSKLDLRLTATKDLWTVNLYAKNVANERGLLSSGSILGSVATADNPYAATVIEPTTIGLSIERRF